jgi:hypothetical protein
MAIGVFICSLGLFLDQSMCRRKFGFISIIFNLICFNPLFAN